MLAPFLHSVVGFAMAPTLARRSSGPTLRTPAALVMDATLNPYDAIASPLRKFEAPSGAAAAGGNPLQDLPLEVTLLFAAIVVVGIAGLVKQSGALSDAAPTLGLGDSREDLVEEAAEAEKELSQGEKEKKYFAILAEEQAGKRGGSKQGDHSARCSVCSGATPRTFAFFLLRPGSLLLQMLPQLPSLQRCLSPPAS